MFSTLNISEHLNVSINQFVFRLLGVEVHLRREVREVTCSLQRARGRIREREEAISRIRCGV